MIPVATLTLLLSLIAQNEHSRAMRLLQEDDPTVPRLWFSEDPSVVPAPFSWHSDRGTPIVRHPYRTLHTFIRPTEFITLTSTSPDTVPYKKEHMLEHYLGPAEKMVSGELEPNFPVPWIQIKHRDGTPRVTSHEGRHRSLLAQELGMKVMPLVVVLRHGPEGWEHQQDSIESDPIVQALTAGRSVVVRTQDHGRDYRPRPFPYSLTPMAPNGMTLRRVLSYIRAGAR